jgi:twitching motility protein PilT
VTLLDSLLDAIVRLDGEALIMHAGEKPFVVLSSASESSFRGPLSWGQVELSSRPLTTEALLGMLSQMLSSDQSRMLDEVGAIEHEIAAPGHSGERFIVTAARGGDDVWVEVRRRVKAAPAAAVDARGEHVPAPPAPEIAPMAGASARAIPSEHFTPELAPPAVASQPHAASEAEIAAAVRASPPAVDLRLAGDGDVEISMDLALEDAPGLPAIRVAEGPDGPGAEGGDEGETEVLFEIATPAPYVQSAADRVDTDEIGAEAAAAFEISEPAASTPLPELIPSGRNAGAEAALAAEVEAFAARKAAMAAEAETALSAREAALASEGESVLAATIASLGAEAEASLAARAAALADEAHSALAAKEAALASEAQAALAAKEAALAVEAGTMVAQRMAALAAEAETLLAAREASLASEAQAALAARQAALAAEAESVLGARVAALAAEAHASLAAREAALAADAETALASRQAALAAEAEVALAAREAELAARAEAILVEKVAALASEAQAALAARETALAAETLAALAAKQSDLAADAEAALAARIAALAGNAERTLAAREAAISAQLETALAAKEAALGQQLEGVLAARETALAAREAAAASLVERAEEALSARAAAVTADAETALSARMAALADHAAAALAVREAAAATDAEAALAAKIAALAEHAEAALAVREAALAASSEAALAEKVAALAAHADAAFAAREAAIAAESERAVSDKIAALAAAADTVLGAKEAALAAEADMALAATLEALAAAARPALGARPLAAAPAPAIVTAAGPLESEPGPASASALVLPLARPGLKLQPPAPPLEPPAASTEASLVELLRAVTAHRASTLYAVVNTRPMMRVEGRIALAGTQAPIVAGDVERFIFEFAPREQVAHTAPEWTCTVPGVGRVRCVTFNDHSGTGLIFHLPASDASSADELGLGREVQALCREADGLVVVAGPRSSGKSTLLNAFVDLINRTRYDHVITIESQIRVVHHKRLSFISQREVRGDGDAIAEAARAALREGPDVLVIEDLRAPEALVAALDAARAGRLVFGSISAPTAPVAVERLIDAFPAERRPQVRASLAGALRAVVAQLLVPGTAGGRVAAREVLLSSPAARQLILHGATWQLPIAIESGRGLGMTTMVDSLGSLVRDGAVGIADACGSAPDRAALVAALERDGVDVSNLERRA